jgi:hypothetical protein
VLLDLSHVAMKVGDCDLAIATASQLVTAVRNDPDRSLMIGASDWVKTAEWNCPMAIIGSAPAGASLWLDADATPRSETPWHGRLKAGTHPITLKLDGFEDNQRHVDVTAGRPTVETVPLLRRSGLHRTARVQSSGIVYVATTPSGASVAIDGIIYGVGPIELSVPAGTHTLSASMSGYPEASKTFNVVAGRLTQYLLNLQTGIVASTDVGAARVTTSPPAAEVESRKPLP